MEKSWRNGRRIGRHCQIRLSHARRPWKKRKKGGEGKRRSGRTRNKNGGEKGKDEKEEEGGSEEEEEGGGIRGRFPTLSTGRVSAGLRPRSRILMGRRHLVLLCRYPLPANPMSCHPFA